MSNVLPGAPNSQKTILCFIEMHVYHKWLKHHISKVNILYVWFQIIIKAFFRKVILTLKIVHNKLMFLNKCFFHSRWWAQKKIQKLLSKWRSVVKIALQHNLHPVKKEKTIRRKRNVRSHFKHFIIIQKRTKWILWQILLAFLISCIDQYTWLCNMNMNTLSKCNLNI